MNGKKIEYIENPDIRGCYYLRQLINKQSLMDINNLFKEGATKKDINDQKKMINSYVNKSICSNKVCVNYVNGKNNNNLGRLYACGGIQLINNVIRGFLFKHTTDIDAKNCHPTILRWLCEKYNIECPNLSHYIYNTEDVFKSNGGKEFVKSKIINLINNDYKKKKTEENEFIKNIDFELKKIRSQIVYREKYAEIIKSIDKSKENYEGSAISYILQFYENEILQEVIKCLKNKSYNIEVLMFDGLMISGNHYNNKALLTEIESYINGVFENLNMKFDYKQHDNSMIIPDDFEYTEFKIVSTDREAGIFFYQQLKNILKSYNGRLFFKQDNIWICDEKKILNYLSLYILDGKCFKENKDGIVPFCQNLKGSNNILDIVVKEVKVKNDDPELYDKFHSSTKNVLCFNDGVLYFKNKSFVKWADIEDEIYSCVKINRNFEHYFNNPEYEVIEELKKKMFIDAYGDKTDEFFHFLSRSMSGNVQDKRYATYLGNRNCGKSAEYDLLKNAFGDYVNTFEISNILYSKNTDGFDNLDASKKLYWLIDLEFTRMAISQEVPESKRGLKVNSKILKKISGGSDTIVARRNYDRQDTHFNIDTSFYMKGNDPLNMDSIDCNETRLEYHSVLKYASAVEIQNMIDNEVSKLEIQKYKIADPMIKDKCKTEEWGNALIFLVIQNYKDHAVPKRNNDDDDDDETNHFFDDLLKMYIITDNHNDMILCSTLEDDMDKYDKKSVKNELQNVNVFKVKCKKRGDYRDKFVYTGIKINDIVDVEM
jgi:hypothetical protein